MQFSRIIVYGYPRTGSMWVYNILREIVQLCRYDIIPKRIPKSDKEMLKIHKNNLDINNKKIISIIKVHTLLDKYQLKDAFIFMTKRDPRDSLISYMRFMKVKNWDIAHKLEHISGYIDSVKHLRNTINSQFFLEIDYKDITLRPINLIMKILNFLKIDLKEDQIIDISKKYSKDSVKKIIEKKDLNIKKKLAKNEKVSNNEVVIMSPDNIRTFDENTGFQSNHVSNYKDGDWNNILASDEIKEINSKFEAWIEFNN